MKQNQEKLKTIQNLLTEYVNNFLSNFNKSQVFFLFFTENLILSFPVPHWVSDNTDLYLNSNISKTKG